MEEKELKINGMHCPSCVAAVEFSLTDLEGVETAKANLETKKVTIKIDNTKVTDDDLIEAIENVGFKIE